MVYRSHFSIGDKVWCIIGENRVEELTVGQIRIIHTDSPGREGEELFDNFKPQKDYEEEYMCVETGIKSGSVFTWLKNIFATQAEAEQAIIDHTKMEG